MANVHLGVDVGGSAIKAGLVDVVSGRLVGEDLSVDTPQPATPDAVIAAISGIDRRLQGSGRVGFAFPSVVKRGVARTASNVDQSWIGVDGAARLGDALGRPVVFLNDADAAGLAEMRFGAGRGESGTVIVLTFGTGIGSAPFIDGHLLPNTEFGHLEMRGGAAEHWAAARVVNAESLSWPQWGARVSEYLAQMEKLFWPDLFIFCGGISERFDDFAPFLQTRAQVRVAALGAAAGLIGAALAAA